MNKFTLSLICSLAVFAGLSRACDPVARVTLADYSCPTVAQVRVQSVAVQSVYTAPLQVRAVYSAPLVVQREVVGHAYARQAVYSHLSTGNVVVERAVAPHKQVVRSKTVINNR